MTKTNRRSHNRYDDIINMPRHVSKKHPQMPLASRAAQFAPFAALSGHKETIMETGRLTTERNELDENVNALLNHKLQYLLGEIERDDPSVFFL